MNKFNDFSMENYSSFAPENDQDNIMQTHVNNTLPTLNQQIENDYNTNANYKPNDFPPRKDFVPKPPKKLPPREVSSSVDRNSHSESTTFNPAKKNYLKNTASSINHTKRNNLEKPPNHNDEIDSRDRSRSAQKNYRGKNSGGSINKRIKISDDNLAKHDMSISEKDIYASKLCSKSSSLSSKNVNASSYVNAKKRLPAIKNETAIKIEACEQNTEEIRLKDLCEEDKSKIGKLMEKLAEEKEKRLQIERQLGERESVYSNRIFELREDNKQLIMNSEDLENKFKQSLTKLKDVSQERSKLTSTENSYSRNLEQQYYVSPGSNLQNQKSKTEKPFKHNALKGADLKKKKSSNNRKSSNSKSNSPELNSDYLFKNKNVTFPSHLSRIANITNNDLEEEYPRFADMIDKQTPKESDYDKPYNMLNFGKPEKKSRKLVSRSNSASKSTNRKSRSPPLYQRNLTEQDARNYKNNVNDTKKAIISKEKNYDDYIDESRNQHVFTEKNVTKNTNH